MLFPALLLATTLDPQTAAVLTNIVAAAAAEAPAIDVVTAEDLRQVLDQEASRRSMGCDADASCLSEVANAMGARVVLYGTAAQLDDELIVTVQLFDSKTSSGARGIARAVNKRDLAKSLAEQTRKLVAEYLAHEAPPAGQRVRCIVMDLKPDAPAAPVAPAPAPLLAWTGLGVAGLGAAGIVAGASIDAFAVAPLNTKATTAATPQLDSAKAYTDRDNFGVAALVCYGVGGALAVAGAAVYVFAGHE